jgi:DNA polymerase-3 subunit gamma/tau
MLSKGYAEVQSAEKALQAAEMVLVRLAYAADLPTPDETLRALRDGEGGAGGGGTISGRSRPPGTSARLAVAAEGGRGSAPQVAPAPKAAAPLSVPRLARLEDIAALAAARRDLPVKLAVERFIRPVKIEDGRLEIALAEGAPADLAGELTARLSEWTGKRWMVIVSADEGGPTLAEIAAARRDAMVRDVRADPLVVAVLTRFPGAEIVDVRRRDLAAADPDPDAAVAETPAEPGDDEHRD